MSVLQSEPNFVVNMLPSVDVPPTIVRKKEPSLTLQRIQGVSIPPREVYHPAIHNACQAMFEKHIDDLTPEDTHKFNFYRRHKTEIGEPLETEMIYLPVGVMRLCLNCGELT